jgi:multiple sugar transport system permease protein
MPKVNWAHLFLIPAISILLILAIYPTIYAIYMSFHGLYLERPELGLPFVGLANYLELFTYPDFWNSLKVTFIFVPLTVVFSLFLGLGLALILNEEFKGRGIIRSILILPLVLTPVVIGFNWRFMYSETVGVIPYLLKLIGIQVKSILGEPIPALLAVLIVDVWQWTPFMLLILLSGLQMIPKDPYEAAEIDGATSWQKFRHITLPLLKPAVLVALVMRTMDAIRTFDTIWVITGGGPGSATELLTILGYRVTFEWFRIGAGSAFAIVILFISVAIANLYIKYLVRGAE